MKTNLLFIFAINVLFVSCSTTTKNKEREILNLSLETQYGLFEWDYFREDKPIVDSFLDCYFENEDKKHLVLLPIVDSMTNSGYTKELNAYYEKVKSTYDDSSLAFLDSIYSYSKKVQTYKNFKAIISKQ